MKKILSYLFITSAFVNCSNPAGEAGHNIRQNDSSIKKHVKNPVKIIANQDDRYYEFIRDIESRLALAPIENSDSIEIRIWNYESFSDSKLVILKQTGQLWSASLNTLKFHSEDNSTDLKYVERNETFRTPKSGWQKFMSNLDSLKLFTLPDCNSLANYCSTTDGNAVIVEYAKASVSRFYKYTNPTLCKNKFQEARYIVGLLEEISKELDFEFN